MGDRSGEASTLNNIGAVYDDLGEKQEALRYYEQALPLCRAVGDRAGEASTRWNMGALFKNQNRFEDARRHLQQALALFEAVKSPHAAAVRKQLAALDAT